MKQIKFTSVSEYHFKVAEKPYPAAQAIPDWWKNSPAYLKEDGTETKKFKIINRISNTGFKKCAPMLDGLTSGYIIPLWADVHAEINNDEPYLNWRVTRPVFQEHGKQARDIPNPKGYNKTVFKYLNPWLIQTPPGYSFLAIEPLGYRGLPFRPIPAVIDADVSTLELLFPVWVKEGIDEVVEAGTPIVQILPFKRDSWVSEFIEGNREDYQTLEDANFGKHLINHYSRRVRQKKSYK
jgi:hypothetical protein